MNFERHFLRIALAASLLLTMAPAVNAVDFSVFGSYFDTSDLAETYGGGVRLGLFHRIQLQLAGTLYDSVEESIPIPGGGMGSVDVDMTAIDGGVAFYFGGKATGFNVGGGLSYFIFDEATREADDEVGYYGQIGYQFKHFFLEGKYRVIEGTVEEIIDGIKQGVDVSIDGISVNAGWRF